MRQVRSSQPLLVLLLCLATHLACSAFAQTYLGAVGNPSFGVNLPVPNGFINIANGNLHLEIPLSTQKQRGQLKLNERLVYDSRIWQILHYSGYYWYPTNVANSQAGWRFVKGDETGTIGTSPTTQNTSCWNGYYWEPYSIYTYYYNWTDPSGTNHPFSAASTSYNIPYDCQGQTPGPHTSAYSGWATDASGYYATLSTNTDGSTSVTIKDGTGTQVYPQVIDRFGNFWSDDANGNLVDDRGMTPVITTQSGNVTYYDVLAPNGPISNNGKRVRYTVTTQQLTITTAFNQSGVTEYQQNGNPPGSYHPQITAIQSIGLPDGSSYQFSYDSYGEIYAVTLPTGGVVNYGWSNYTDSYQNVNRWITSSMIDGANTLYTPSVISQCSSNGTGCQEAVNVHRPSGDETVYTMTLNNGAWDTNTTVYQGPASSNQPKVKSVNTYDFSQPCGVPGCSGAQNITKTYETNTLPDVNLSTRVQTAYASPWTGQMTTWSQWDYYASGSSPSSTPTRQIQYGYTGFDLTSEGHLDSNGAVVSSITYTYSNSASTAPTLQGHGIANAGGPYLTSVSVSNNAPVTTLTSSSTYDTAGTVLSTTDRKSNPATFYHYDPTDTFVTEIDKPSTTNAAGSWAHTSKASYDPDSGALLSSDDENSVAHNQAYSVIYAYEATAGRLHSVSYPDGGGSTYSYPNPNEIDVSSLQSLSPLINVTAVQKVDGYGRTVNSSSGGITTTIGYDSNGRKYSATNPSSGSASPTDGTSYMFYDALDRMTLATNPDGSSKTATYLGNTSTVSDELGNQKKQTFDAFGQLRTVLEADPVTGSLTLETDYQYDALGNLTCVEQHGNVSGTGCSANPSSDRTSPWRVRRFFYDQLSQLRAAQVPEHTGQWSNGGGANYYPPSQNCGTPDNSTHWTDCYYYDPNGNQSQTVDNRGVQTMFTWDFLNRLTGKSASNFQSLWAYDSGTNGVGLLASESNGTSAGSSLGYDVMGRITTDAACRNAGCGSNAVLTSAATYDLSGNLITLTYPDGRTMKTGYDVLNRPISLVYQSWNGQPTGPTYWLNPTYAPTGQLTAAQYGQVGQSGALNLQAAFNNRLSLTSLSYTNPSGNVFGKNYKWDLNAANLIKETTQSSSQVRQFGYDKLNRLISAADISNTGSKATGTATVSGVDGMHQVCNDPPGGPIEPNPNKASPNSTTNPQPQGGGGCTYQFDTGVLSLTVGSFTAYTPYQGFSTPADLASDLSSQLNGGSSPVTATVGSPNPSDGSVVITMTSKATGTTANYQMSWSTDQDFEIDLSGNNMTGGQDGAPSPGGLNQQYALDNWGNLSSMGSSGFSQTVGNQNQVVAYLYDAAGRVVFDNTNSQTYTYSDENLLASSSNGVSYSYDAEHLRTSVAASGTSTDYYYFAGQLIAVRNAATGQWTDMLNVGDQKIGYVNGTQTAVPTYVAADQVGSEVASVDASGNLMSSLDYTPFGSVISGQGADNFIFTGLQRDGAGLDHATERQYSFAAARWITPDPYDGSFSAVDPQSLNRNTYVQNPLLYTDPSGQFAVCGVTSAGADGGLVVAGPIGWVLLGTCIGDTIWHIFDLFGHSRFKGSLKPRPEARQGTGTPNWDNALNDHLGLPKWLHQQPSGLGGILGGTQQGCEFGACEGSVSGGFQQAGTAVLPAIGGAAACAAAEPCGAIAVGVGAAVLIGGAIYEGRQIYRNRTNVADTGITEEAQRLIGPNFPTICDALAYLQATTRDSARLQKIKATQKAFGCRRNSTQR